MIEITASSLSDTHQTAESVAEIIKSGDLSLDDLSPAINSGVLLNGYLIDINGNTRLNPDIGAYEK